VRSFWWGQTKGPTYYATFAELPQQRATFAFQQEMNRLGVEKCDPELAVPTNDISDRFGQH
jgi:hypothetical protein